MASYGSRDGGGSWSTVPVRSRRAEPLAPSPRGGSTGGGDDRVPGVGGLAEAVDGLEIGGGGDIPVPGVGGLAEAVDGLDIGGEWHIPALWVGEFAEDVDGLEIGGEWHIPVEVTGEGAPDPVDGFEAAGLAEAVLRNVARYGYEYPTPVQCYAMPIVMAGRDLVVCGQIVFGKRAAFFLPVVSGLLASAERGRRYGYGRRGRVAKPRALILVATRTLAAQINEEAKLFSFQTGLRVMYNELHDIERGVDLLVATPRHLVDMVKRSLISLEAIEYLVLYEADRMLDMGSEPQIRKIVDMMNMPKKTRLASDFLYNYIRVTVGSSAVGSSAVLMEQKIEFVKDGEKRDFLMELLQKQFVGVTDSRKARTMVFVETKEEAVSLFDYIHTKGFPTTVIHDDITQLQRERALKCFKSGATIIMVATDVASRGLNLPDVAHVIYYDLPKSIEEYVHRIRRTERAEKAGRAGKAGTATAFFTESNQPLAKDLLELMTEANQDVPAWLVEYANMP